MGDKTVYFGVAVVPDNEVESGTADGRGGYRYGRVSVIAQGVGAAKTPQPDHDFVRLGARGRKTEEGVVGDIGD